MEDRNELIRWIKKNKKLLIAVGISIGALILVVLVLKNKALIKALWVSLKGIAKEPTAKAVKKAAKVVSEAPPEPIQEVVTAVASNSKTLPFEVSRHIRNLPIGQHASPEKVAEALLNNIILMDGQTWVDNYMKGIVTA